MLEYRGMAAIKSTLYQKAKGFCHKGKKCGGYPRQGLASFRSYPHKQGQTEVGRNKTTQALREVAFPVLPESECRKRKFPLLLEFAYSGLQTDV
jgi:hypothetical protein